MIHSFGMEPKFTTAALSISYEGIAVHRDGSLGLCPLQRRVARYRGNPTLKRRCYQDNKHLYMLQRQLSRTIQLQS